jgi:uncharacterized Zn-finger protein
MILVPLFDLEFLNDLAASVIGTSIGGTSLHQIRALWCSAKYRSRTPSGSAAEPPAAAEIDHATQPTSIMSEEIVPHFHNTPGVAVIEIGAREFMCIGELAPFDHPHVFLDMGDADEIICPYCSTLYRHNPQLDAHSAQPAECALPDSATA